MDSLEHLLGHDKIVEQIESYISRSEGFRKIILKGEPGSGKSWLIHRLVSVMPAKDLTVIHLIGDSSRKNEPYYPLSLFVERRKKLKKTGMDVMYSALTEVPIVGKPLKALIEGVELNKIISNRKINDISEFKGHVSFSMRVLGLMKKYGKVLLLCENFADFDPTTVKYLFNLKNGLHKTGSSSSLFIVVDGSNSLETKEGLEFKLGSDLTIETSLPQRENIGKILQSMGFDKHVPESTVELIYSCSGGHLSLLRLIADYLAQDFRRADNFQSNTEIFEHLIGLRIGQANMGNDKVQTLLNIMANVGTQIAKTELVCLSNNNGEVFDTLGLAQNLDFIYLRDNYIHFSHEIIQKVFEQSGSNTKMATWNQLSTCIKKLSPSNYVRRALLEKNTGNLEQADILWCIVAIGKMRSGQFEEAAEIPDNLSSAKQHYLKDVLIAFDRCYRLGFEGKATEALASAEDIPNAIPLLLVAEKCCFECEILSKNINLWAKESMLEKLRPWNELKEEEPEVWYRIMQLRILAACELGKKEMVKGFEFEIINFYSNRLLFDNKAEEILNRLDIYAELIYSPEVSHKKLLKVEQKLSSALEHDLFDQIIDLYIARVNLSSNCLLLGMYEQAVSFAVGALGLAREYLNIHFPTPELPLNNLYLASLFSGALGAEEVSTKFGKMLKEIHNEEDYTLLQVNHAGLLLNAGYRDLALDHLKRLDVGMDITVTEPYYYYYFRYNLALLKYLNGETQIACREIQELESVVDRVYPSSLHYYRKHYDLVKSIICNGPQKNYIEMKSSFQSECGEFLGPMWEKFKKVYLFSDLQIWTSF